MYIVVFTRFLGRREVVLSVIVTKLSTNSFWGDNMTKMEKKLEEIQMTLYSWGWTRDKWGHMKKKTGKFGEVELRVKTQKTSLRLERGVRDYKGHRQWVRRSSDYIKNIRIEPEGIVIGGCRIKAKPEDRPSIPKQTSLF